MYEKLFIPLLLSFVAGLSTVIGGVIGALKKPSKRFLAFSLGISAGTMITVSYGELLPLAVSNIGFLPATAVFTLGIIVSLSLEYLIPHDYIFEKDETKKGAMRAGLVTMAGLAIHNMPEGLAVFVSGLTSLDLGLVMAVAIVAHNIPEGIAVSAPINYATKDRKKAIWYSFLSGITEPLGAVLGLIIFGAHIDPFLLDMILAFVSGIMVAISIDELLPLAHSCHEDEVRKDASLKKGHVTMAGFLLGATIMNATIYAFR
jgi:ZIP family zinc transporter